MKSAPPSLGSERATRKGKQGPLRGAQKSRARFLYNGGKLGGGGGRRPEGRKKLRRGAKADLAHRGNAFPRESQGHTGAREKMFQPED